MRYSEIKVAEANMSPNALTIASKVDALCGIEFEMVMLDSPSPGAEDPGPLKLDAIVDFFTPSNPLRGDPSRMLSAAFAEYLEDEYWEKNKRKLVMSFARKLWSNKDARTNFVNTHLSASSSKEDDFWAMAAKENSPLYTLAQSEYEYRSRDDNPARQVAWVAQTFGNMRGVAKKYALNWPTVIKSPDDFWNNTAAEFKNMIGKNTVVSKAHHASAKTHTSYTMEPDSSIEGKHGEYGVEWVSPPMKLDDMISDLKKIIKWSHDKGAYTNSSTGLHCNVSVPNFKDFDYVKLVLFLGDKYILEQFGREMNTYCESALAKLHGSIEEQTDNTVAHLLDMIKFGGSEMAAKLLSRYATEKYSSINVHQAENYVEFRSPGGDWLNTDINILVTSLRRFVVAVDIACDKTKYKDEYNKKLYKILTNAIPLFQPTELVYSPENVEGRLNLLTLIGQEANKLNFTKNETNGLINIQVNSKRAIESETWLDAIDDITNRLSDTQPLLQIVIRNLQQTQYILNRTFTGLSLRDLLTQINTRPRGIVWGMLLEAYYRRRHESNEFDATEWKDNVLKVLPKNFKYKKLLYLNSGEGIEDPRRLADVIDQIIVHKDDRSIGTFDRLRAQYEADDRLDEFILTTRRLVPAEDLPKFGITVDDDSEDLSIKYAARYSGHN